MTSNMQFHRRELQKRAREHRRYHDREYETQLLRLAPLLANQLSVDDPVVLWTTSQLVHYPNQNHLLAPLQEAVTAEVITMDAMADALRVQLVVHGKLLGRTNHYLACQALLEPTKDDLAALRRRATTLETALGTQVRPVAVMTYTPALADQALQDAFKEHCVTPRVSPYRTDNDIDDWQF